MSTPCATYEGSLEEFTQKPEEGLIELHETLNNDEPLQPVVDLVANYIFTNNQEPAMPIIMTEEEKSEYTR